MLLCLQLYFKLDGTILVNLNCLKNVLMLTTGQIWAPIIKSVYYIPFPEIKFFGI